VLYQLSYMGIKQAGNETRTHNSHLGRVELYQLSYARENYKWAGVGSNHRRLTPMDLQSIPFNRSGTYPTWSRWRESNPRPFDYKSNALSSELHRQAVEKKSVEYIYGVWGKSKKQSKKP
jgi:hypothetical protein